MAPRRASESPFEELLLVLTDQPLWVSVAAAVVLLLPGWVPLTVAGGRATQPIWDELRHGWALALTVLVILAGLVGVVKRLARRHLPIGYEGLGDIRDMKWQEFEKLVGEAYRRLGYTVAVTGGGGPDGGFERDLRGKDGRTLVQCKQWRSFQVGVRETRELLGVLVHEGADRAVLITTGSFTPDALALARGEPIDLIDGNGLAKLIKEVRMAPQATVAPAPALSPTCPKCGNEMVRRIAPRGPDAGSAFWGCSTYPACTGTQ